MAYPEKQSAIQLTGPEKLILTTDKPVDKPGPYQILARIDAVGICFSDLKLLKQFSNHPRKAEVVSGIDKDALSEIPSYKPGNMPTVPGHEAVCTVVATGERVVKSRVGQRALIQTDYRWLKTESSNSAFGYNFEGALQQYVIMDERVIVDPESNSSMLIEVDNSLSASAVALVEPWACVENSYITADRNRILENGRLLVIADPDHSVEGLKDSLRQGRPPSSISACCANDKQLPSIRNLGCGNVSSANLDQLSNESFDDIVYFGHNPSTLETAGDKLAAGGLINVVLGGHTLGRPVSVGVGRIHYGPTRWIGTTGANAAESYAGIPANGEVRDDDKVLVMGAAGPMGQMHTIRLICAGKKNLFITATDFDDSRLKALARKAELPMKQNNVALDLVNPQKDDVQGPFSYTVIMAPVGELVAKAVTDSAPGALINVFAGIPASVKQEIDMDKYISNQCYLFGTSGSTLADMQIVLEKVTSGQLDTNLSVDAVSGMAGAIDGLQAVEKRELPGKIVVYPSLADMPLTPLTDLTTHSASVADKLDNNIWTKTAEDELLKKSNTE